MRILFTADIFAQAGRRMASIHIPALLREREVDLVIANGENAAGGFGLTDNLVGKLHSYGVDVITSGNHIWDRKEFVPQLDRGDRVLRPFNYPPGAPGRGSTIVESRSGHKVGVLCLQGRTSMPSTDCPFRLGKAEAERLREQTPIVFVDFHAEATAEKMALGWYLDEGVDQRVLDNYNIQEVSLGDFVMTGGELAAQAMIDATVRLLPDVLGNAESTLDESHSNGLLEHPQYTRPAEWMGLEIPEVLTSGNHAKVAEWRKAQSEILTQQRRPDLWEKRVKEAE